MICIFCQASRKNLVSIPTPRVAVVQERKHKTTYISGEDRVNKIISCSLLPFSMQSCVQP